MSLQEYLCTGSSKVTSYGFWQEKSPVIGPPGGRFNSTPGTYLNSTLGFAYPSAARALLELFLIECARDPDLQSRKGLSLRLRPVI